MKFQLFLKSSFSTALFSAAVLAGIFRPPAARGQTSAPVISSAASLDVYYQVELQGGNTFSYHIVASNSPTSYGATGLPATATLTASTGWIYGNSSYPGLYSVTLSATNGTGTATAPLSLAIHPAILGVSNSGNTAYPAGTTLSITVQFNAPVGVIGAPSVTLTLGSPASGTREAAYVSGSGTDTLVFAYTPGANDLASTVAPLSTLNLNGGSIRDANGLDAGASLPAQQTGSAFSSVSFTAGVSGSGSNSASAAPSFILQPQSSTVAAGSSVVFSAQATASASVSYQWTHNGVAIAGATGADLLLSNTAATDAGSYAVVASNSAGNSTSSAATLSVVTTADPGRLMNLSILSDVQTSLTLGFVVGGQGASGPENVLIRGLGPALSAFGLDGLLADPTLAVVQQNSQTVLATNAGWRGAKAVVAADLATGAFPLNDATSADSAMVLPLMAAAGGYTVQIAGQSGDSGTALAEVYDDTAAYTNSTPHLINLSCLTPLTAGGSLSAGFVVGGATSKTVLIRALGPALSAFGVSSPVPDPQVTLRSLGSNTVVGSAQGGAGSAELSSVATSVGAFQIASSTSADSAMVVTLAPGDYTAEVSSVSGAAGSVLVEVYEVQ
jgi:hypothetical protein